MVYVCMRERGERERETLCRAEAPLGSQPRVCLLFSLFPLSPSLLTLHPLLLPVLTTPPPPLPAPVPSALPQLTQWEQRGGHTQRRWENLGQARAPRFRRPLCSGTRSPPSQASCCSQWQRCDPDCQGEARSYKILRETSSHPSCRTSCLSSQRE